METRSHIEPKAAAPPAFTPVGGGFLQRKCACSGSGGIGGECDGCSQRGLSLQRSTRNSELETRDSEGAPPIAHKVLRSPSHPLDAPTRARAGFRLGHDFGSMRVHAAFPTAAFVPNLNPRAATSGADFNLRTDRDRSLTTLDEESLDWQTESFDGEGAAQPSDVDAVPTEGGTRGPATLPGTKSGGISCDASTGGTVVNVLNKEPCTTECSASHEQKHAVDIGPCCTKAGAAAKKAEKQEEKDAVQEKFDVWMIDNVNFLECRAYAVSITCGETKKGKLKCPDSHDKCCGPLNRYISSAMRQKEGTCNNAGPKLTDCPF